MSFWTDLLQDEPAGRLLKEGGIGCGHANLACADNPYGLSCQPDRRPLCGVRPAPGAKATRPIVPPDSIATSRILASLVMSVHPVRPPPARADANVAGGSAERGPGRQGRRPTTQAVALQETSAQAARTANDAPTFEARPPVSPARITFAEWPNGRAS